MGVRLRDTNPDKRMATVITRENSRNSLPTIPPMNSTGINTAAREMVMETMVKLISLDPSRAA